MTATLLPPVAQRPATDRAAARAHEQLATLLARDKVPGVQYAIVSAHDTRFQFAGGWADLAQRRPVTDDTTWLAYSLSKSITALTALRLAEDGALDLDTDITGWLPWQPYGAITARQLLAHTAGVPNPLPLAWVHAPHDERFNDAAALREVVRTHPRRIARPDTRVVYSNIGYWLLGAVIETVTGRTFADAVTAALLAPLGLAADHLGYVQEDGMSVAAGYVERRSALWWLRRWLIDARWRGDVCGRWGTMQPHRVNGAAYGGAIGSAGAFARVLQAVLAGLAHDRAAIVGPRMATWLSTPHRLANGHSVAMALGWNVRWRTGRHGVERQLFKEGGGAGYHHLMRIYPQHGLASVLMSNATGLDVHQLLDDVDAEFLLQP